MVPLLTFPFSKRNKINGKLVNDSNMPDSFDGFCSLQANQGRIMRG